MRAVYKDLLLSTMEERLLDYSELRRRVRCCMMYVTVFDSILVKGCAVNILRVSSAFRGL